MLPKKYEILRGVENSSKIRVPLEKHPQQVWTLLNEEQFLQEGLRHHYTAFIEDSMHDWDWRDGQFRFYGHSGEPGGKHDLVIVYAQTLREVVPREFEESYMDKRPRMHKGKIGVSTPSVASKLLDVEVVKEHHRVSSDGYWRVWPGVHKHVFTWWELSDGRAVGWNESPTIGWSFPVIRLRKGR